MNRAAIDAFFCRLSEQNPEPKTELNAVNPYTLLVAVVLSAQMTDSGVNKATEKLFQKVQTPQAMLALGEEALKEHIKSVNLCNTKARHIIALSAQLIDRFGGEIPRDREALESLPGVGRKTANVVMNVCFDAPVMPVDTHVFRVANRTGMATGQTPQEVEEKLLQVIPQKWMRHAHHWLILHGRYVCKACAPACPTCLVRDLCVFYVKHPKTEDAS